MEKRTYYNMETVGKNMRAIRKSRKLTAEQVREYLELECIQSIYKWERGECFPQADTLISLCVLYRINPLEMFGEVLETSPIVFYVVDSAFDEFEYWKIRKTKIFVKN